MPPSSPFDLEAAKAAISAALCADLARVSVDELKGILAPAIEGRVTSVPILNIGTPVCRARITEKPQHLRDLFYPPPGLAQLGRVNRPGTSVLYCSASREGALFEVAPVAGNTVVLAQWRTTAPMVVHPVSATAAREIFSWYRARQKLRLAVEAQFQEALASDSLKVLGRYLDDAVGQFSVAEYGRSQDVRHRVNMFLARVEEFVGKTEEFGKLETPVGTSMPTESADLSQDPELQLIEDRVLTGAVWDGLAHLRRTIEQRLRGLAAQRGITTPERSGASRLVEVLRRHEIGREEDWLKLREAIAVCNRGVHGLDVSTSQAIDVVRAARYALESLGLSRPASSR